MNTKLLISAFLFPVLLWSQNNNGNVSRTYYKDGMTQMELWRGDDKLMDSLKTYYSNGKLNEVFYYDEKGLKNADSYQFDDQGDKLVTWTFAHGKLINRTNHKLPFNNVNKEIVQETLKSLNELNARTNYNPTTISDIYKRGHLQYRLGNTTLALNDIKRTELLLDNLSKNTKGKPSDSASVKIDKFKAHLYDLLANLYTGLEQKNMAANYFYKAMIAAPKDLRILYNFANHLQVTKSDDLALFYLKKILAENPNFGFARLSIARIYSDTGEYEKALENINVAFQREDAIKKGSTGWTGRDLRTTRGLIYHKLGQSEKGIADLKEALRINDKNSYAMKNLGIIYLDQKKYNEACELFEKAKKLNYALVFDENDLDPLLQSACNNVQTEIVIEKPKAFVYPNPATTVITIHNYDFKIFDFEFFDFESNSVLRGKTTDGSIDVSRLNSGFYILKIFNTNSPQTFKIIKE
ncbi:tetratricopeptide repeat protein [Flavobacterium sp. WC2509]|uniref:tetratricopeptide repeat protein n=1 Tax=Flavobacterium sp. WC2509 TaxID=3461406 RepID=UPI0040450FC4